MLRAHHLTCGSCRHRFGGIPVDRQLLARTGIVGVNGVGAVTDSETRPTHRGSIFSTHLAGVTLQHRLGGTLCAHLRGDAGVDELLSGIAGETQMPSQLEALDAGGVRLGVSSVT